MLQSNISNTDKTLGAALTLDKTVLLRNNKAVAKVVILPDVIGVRPPVNVSPRVLSQSPAAGLQFPRGTTVNLVLADGAVISAAAVSGSYVGWNDMNLGNLYNNYLVNDATMTDLVSKYASEQTLTAAEQAQALQILNAKEVSVGASPGHDLNSILTTLGASYAFNSLAG
jgi:hypothetical protein